MKVQVVEQKEEPTPNKVVAETKKVNNIKSKKLLLKIGIIIIVILILKFVTVILIIKKILIELIF